MSSANATGTVITRLLVANRGEIAARVFRTARDLGIETVAVHSDADAGLPFVREADLAVRLPGNTPAETYLRGDLVIEAARAAGADAIHPGYGFLSENAAFARAVVDAGLTWIGPAPESIEQMGSKIEAKKLMEAAGVPVLGNLTAETATAADLPLLVKASAGGGGRGMRIVRSLHAFAGEVEAARAEAESAFGDGTVFVEPYVERGRHVEVQVVGTPDGTIVLGERDCSVQRRHQKVIEEAPAPGLPDATRAALHAAAKAAAEAIDYRGAGTVEFLYDAGRDAFWFLEMNTRLQVEHPVTEAVFGVDLVAMQIAVAEGREVVGPRTVHTPASDPRPEGHAIEVRLYAEDPVEDYRPQSGTLRRFEVPAADGVRVDSGYESGSTVSTFYDAMLAKVIVHAETRDLAIRRLAGVLRRARIHGLVTNRAQLVEVLGSEEFRSGRMTTSLLADRSATPPAIDVDARVAAAIALAESTRRPGVPVAWRNVTSQPQRTEFADDTAVEWYGTRTGYVVDDVEVVSATPGAVTLERDGVRSTYEISIAGDEVDVDGPCGHTALRRKPRFVDPSARVVEGSLLAPMPGTVVSVRAAVGDAVDEGQPIVVMEAMKMQHTIAAPYAGTVTELAASEGQQVEAGAVLAVVEPTESTELTKEAG